MSLAKAVAQKQKKMGIASKIALAAAVGVSIPTIYKLFKSEKFRPNARTVKRYAKFLRLSANKVAQLAGRGGSASATKASRPQNQKKRRSAKA